MVQRWILAVLVATSASALALALFVQHGLGYAPCSLCELARLPHVAVLVLGGIALWRGWTRAGLLLVTTAMLAAFAISLRHVGVEHGWLPLPDDCVVPTALADLDNLRQALMAQTAPSCDQPGPQVLGLSMAQWHVITSLLLAMAAGAALTRGARRS